jgi:hypothetical protein
MYYRLTSLKNKTGAELAQAIAGIPAGVTALDLRSNNFHNKKSAELATAFAGIPASVTSLGLTWNNLAFKTGAELAQAFASIPATVTSLDLSQNYLGNINSTQLATVFKALPEGIQSITFSVTDISGRTEKELIALGKALPHIVSIHVLDSSGKATTHPSINTLRTHIASYVLAAYKMLLDVKFTAPLAGLTLDTLMGSGQFVYEQTKKQVAKVESKENDVSSVATKNNFFKLPTSQEISQFLLKEDDKLSSLPVID